MALSRANLGVSSAFLLFVAATAEVVIEVTDANDHVPQLSQLSYAVRVPEMMPVGSPVVTLEANDNDIGENARLTYTISGADSEFFYVDSISSTGAGVIRIKQVIGFSMLTCSFGR